MRRVPITGTGEASNNVPTISGDISGHISEDQAGFIVGDLNIVDPDAGESLFLMPASLEGAFGTFLPRSDNRHLDL